MAETTLEQVQHLVDTLNLGDQVRLLEYLTPRIAQAVLSEEAMPTAGEDAWDTFFRLGDEIAAEDARGQDSLTHTLIQMRR